MSDTDESAASDERLTSDDDTEGDFEPSAPGQFVDGDHTGRTSPEPIPGLDTSNSDIPEMRAQRERANSRSASMATVRQNRRSQLAEKLRDVFELNDIHEVVAG